MIAIVNYGLGNLASVEKAFRRLGIPAAITDDPGVVEKAPGVVLPGVGAFAAALRTLEEKGLDRAIRTAVDRGAPLLGICLGMQLLFDTSEEGPACSGLGFIRGRVVRLQPGLKVPHMGWNQLFPRRPHPLLEGVEPGAYFYFVHSYYAQADNPEEVLACSDYGCDFQAAVGNDRVMGLQFHPEKSGPAGLSILQNFGGMVYPC